MVSDTLSVQFVEEMKLIAARARESHLDDSTKVADTADYLAAHPTIAVASRADDDTEEVLRRLHERIGFRIEYNLTELWAVRVLIRDLARAGFLRLFDRERARYRTVVPFEVDGQSYEIPWPVASLDENTKGNV